MPHRVSLLSLLALFMVCPATASAQEPLPDLSGQWAQLQVTTSISKIPVVGEVVSTTSSLLILSVEQTGEKLSIKEQICDIKIESTAKRVQTLIPPAFIKAASGTQRTATLSRAGQTIRYEQDPKVVVLGAKLKNPRDALPEDDDDPRVVDADKDGKPGLTVLVRGIVDGEVYVAQRGWNKLTGELRGDLISGKVEWGSEQTTLDATSMLLKSSPTSRPDPRASVNYFRMKRLDGAVTCAQLKANQAALVGK